MVSLSRRQPSQLHRYVASLLMRVLAFIHYVCCLALAVVYFAYSAWAAEGNGISLYRFSVVIVPLLLGGYISGLSFFLPRVAAVATLAFVAFFFALRFFDPFHGAMSVDTFMFAASIVPIGVSIVGLLWHDGSAWRRSKTIFAKILITVLAAFPAIIATWWMVAFTVGVIRGTSRGAT
jgi:hypothetical protein